MAIWDDVMCDGNGECFTLEASLDRIQRERDVLLIALKDMVALYDGIRDSLTSPVVIEKLAAADAAIAIAEAK